jgi:transcriptional regulator with XRE-family HTH domain
MEDFNKRLKLLRKALGKRRGKKKVLQGEMAKFAGVDKQTWWRYENTSRSLDAGVIKKLVQAVNLNPIWFLIGEGPMFIEHSPLTVSALSVAERRAPYDDITGKELTSFFVAEK